MRYQNPSLRRHLATAYALGSLTRRSRARLEGLMRQDPSLRDLIDEQAARYAPLALALPPQAPSPAVWARIETRLGFAAASPAAGAGWRRLFGGVRAGEASAAGGGRGAGRGSARAFGWALPGLAAGLVAGWLIGVASAPNGGLPRQPQSAQSAQSLPSSPSLALDAAQLPASYVGVLADDAGRAGMLVSSLRHGRVADVKLLQPVQLPEGSVLFLWGLPADDSAPIALGALPPGEQVRIDLSDSAERLLSGVSRLGVTLEKAGSTPQTPATPYRFLGFCGKFWR